MNMKHQEIQQWFRRVTALFVIFSMVGSDASLCAAQREARSPSKETAVVAGRLEDIRIPSEWGTIQETYKGKQPETVLFIQDAHGVIAAQNAIYHILKELAQKNSPGLIAAEGANGPFDADLLRAYPDQDSLRRVLGESSNRSELSGVGMSAVFGEKMPAIRGIEDWVLYEKNYFAYLQAQAHQKEVLAFLAGKSGELDAKRKSLYAAPLDLFHKKMDAYQKGQLSIEEWIRYLARMEPATSVREGSQKYPGLRKIFSFIRTTSAEDKQSLDIRVRQVTRQFESQCKSKLDPALRTRFGQFRQQYETGATDAGTYLLELQSMRKAVHGEAPLDADLARLVRGAEDFKSLAGDSAWTRELDPYLQEVVNRLAQTEEERTLEQEYRTIYRLEQMAKLELTREAYGEIKDQAEPSVYAGMPQSAWKSIRSFYDVALARDEAIFRNLEREMRALKTPLAVVVLGGFHTDGFRKRLREKGFSYAIVTPRVGSLDGQDRYRELMMGKFSYAKDFRDGFYSAFQRSISRSLLRGVPDGRGPQVLKEWRDGLLRRLAAQGRLDEAWHYTCFIDELIKQEIAAGRRFQFAGKDRDTLLRAIEEKFLGFRDELLKRQAPAAGTHLMHAANLAFIRDARLSDGFKAIFIDGSKAPAVQTPVVRSEFRKGSDKVKLIEKIMGQIMIHAPAGSYNYALQRMTRIAEKIGNEDLPALIEAITNGIQKLEIRDDDAARSFIREAVVLLELIVERVQSPEALRIFESMVALIDSKGVLYIPDLNILAILSTVVPKINVSRIPQIEASLLRILKSIKSQDKDPQYARLDRARILAQLLAWVLMEESGLFPKLRDMALSYSMQEAYVMLAESKYGPVFSALEEYLFVHHGDLRVIQSLLNTKWNSVKEQRAAILQETENMREQARRELGEAKRSVEEGKSRDGKGAGKELWLTTGAPVGPDALRLAERNILRTAPEGTANYAESDGNVVIVRAEARSQGDPGQLSKEETSFAAIGRLIQDLLNDKDLYKIRPQRFEDTARDLLLRVSRMPEADIPALLTLIDTTLSGIDSDTYAHEIVRDRLMPCLEALAKRVEGALLDRIMKIVFREFARDTSNSTEAIKKRTVLGEVMQAFAMSAGRGQLQSLIKESKKEILRKARRDVVWSLIDAMGIALLRLNGRDEWIQHRNNTGGVGANMADFLSAWAELNSRPGRKDDDLREIHLFLQKASDREELKQLLDSAIQRMHAETDREKAEAFHQKAEQKEPASGRELWHMAATGFAGPAVSVGMRTRSELRTWLLGWVSWETEKLYEKLKADFMKDPVFKELRFGQRIDGFKAWLLLKIVFTFYYPDYTEVGISRVTQLFNFHFPGKRWLRKYILHIIADLEAALVVCSILQFGRAVLLEKDNDLFRNIRSFLKGDVYVTINKRGQVVADYSKWITGVRSQHFGTIRHWLQDPRLTTEDIITRVVELEGQVRAELQREIAERKTTPTPQAQSPRVGGDLWLHDGKARSRSETRAENVSVKASADAVKAMTREKLAMPFHWHPEINEAADRISEMIRQVNDAELPDLLDYFVALFSELRDQGSEFNNRRELAFRPFRALAQRMTWERFPKFLQILQTLSDRYDSSPVYEVFRKELGKDMQSGTDAVLKGGADAGQLFEMLQAAYKVLDPEDYKAGRKREILLAMAEPLAEQMSPRELPSLLYFLITEFMKRPGRDLHFFMSTRIIFCLEKVAQKIPERHLPFMLEVMLKKLSDISKDTTDAAGVRYSLGEAIAMVLMRETGNWKDLSPFSDTDEVQKKLAEHFASRWGFEILYPKHGNLETIRSLLQWSWPDVEALKNAIGQETEKMKEKSRRRAKEKNAAAESPAQPETQAGAELWLKTAGSPTAERTVFSQELFPAVRTVPELRSELRGRRLDRVFDLLYNAFAARLARQPGNLTVAWVSMLFQSILQRTRGGNYYYILAFLWRYARLMCQCWIDHCYEFLTLPRRSSMSREDANIQVFKKSRSKYYIRIPGTVVPLLEGAIRSGHWNEIRDEWLKLLNSGKLKEELVYNSIDRNETERRAASRVAVWMAVLESGADLDKIHELTFDLLSYKTEPFLSKALALGEAISGTRDSRYETVARLLSRYVRQDIGVWPKYYQEILEEGERRDAERARREKEQKAGERGPAEGQGPRAGGDIWTQLRSEMRSEPEASDKIPSVQDPVALAEASIDEALRSLDDDSAMAGGVISKIEDISHRLQKTAPAAMPAVLAMLIRRLDKMDGDIGTTAMWRRWVIVWSMINMAGRIREVDLEKFTLAIIKEGRRLREDDMIIQRANSEAAADNLMTSSALCLEKIAESLPKERLPEYVKLLIRAHQEIANEVPAENVISGILARGLTAVAKLIDVREMHALEEEFHSLLMEMTVRKDDDGSARRHAAIGLAVSLIRQATTETALAGTYGPFFSDEPTVSRIADYFSISERGVVFYPRYCRREAIRGLLERPWPSRDALVQAIDQEIRKMKQEHAREKAERAGEETGTVKPAPSWDSLWLRRDHGFIAPSKDANRSEVRSKADRYNYSEVKKRLAALLLQEEKPGGFDMPRFGNSSIGNLFELAVSVARENYLPKYTELFRDALFSIRDHASDSSNEKRATIFSAFEKLAGRILRPGYADDLAEFLFQELSHIQGDSRISQLARLHCARAITELVGNPNGVVSYSKTKYLLSKHFEAIFRSRLSIHVDTDAQFYFSGDLEDLLIWALMLANPLRRVVFVRSSNLFRGLAVYFELKDKNHEPLFRHYGSIERMHELLQWEWSDEKTLLAAIGAETENMQKSYERAQVESAGADREPEKNRKDYGELWLQSQGRSDAATQERGEPRRSEVRSLSDVRNKVEEGNLKDVKKHVAALLRGLKKTLSRENELVRAPTNAPRLKHNAVFDKTIAEASDPMLSAYQDVFIRAISTIASDQSDNAHQVRETMLDPLGKIAKKIIQPQADQLAVFLYDGLLHVAGDTDAAYRVRSAWAWRFAILSRTNVCVRVMLSVSKIN